MRKMQTRRKPIAEINVVPYIDVMLVLLIIFMVTAPLITQGVQVDLPEANAKTIDSNGPIPIVVSVNHRGQLFLNIAATPSQSVTPEDVYSEVAAALLHAPNRAVMVRADKQTAYETVLDTMVLLQKAGVPSVGLETQDPAG